MIINKNLTKRNFTKGKNKKNEYIVIHYTGSLGDAKAQTEYFLDEKRSASAHCFVGYNGDIWQSVEFADIAWHCGAKKYQHPKCRNSNSIGIEMCTKTTGSTNVADENWYFEDATVNSTINLVKELMIKYNIPVENVIRHYDVTGKVCPAPYVFNKGKHTWDKFIDALKPTVKEQPIDENSENVRVRIDIDNLNIRTGPGTNYPVTGKFTGKGTFTIVKIQNGWGKLKSGAGWISLAYAKRL